MKHILFLLTLLFFIFNAIGQDSLYFSELGFSSAYCRTSSVQSGNGIVYANAEGGTAPYDYLWTNLSTGETYTNTTQGGLNPECFQIQVTDALGATLIDTVCVDSLNPIAGFYLESADLSGDGGYYTGTAPVTATFFNTSENYYAIDPLSDTTIFFRPQGFEPWETYMFTGEMTTYTYEYGGIYTATLIASNLNDCADTAHISINLEGPASINGDQIEKPSYSVWEKNGIITIASDDPKSGIYFVLYDLSGSQIEQTELLNISTKVNVFHPGIYLYEIIDRNKGEKIAANKVVIY